VALLRYHRARRQRPRRVRHAMERLTGWYFTRSIEGYKFLQTGELPPSVVRDLLKVAMARLRSEHRKMLREVRRSI